FMLYTTSVKNNELASAINSKEYNRDDALIKESALIIHYDLLSKINIIKLLYTKFEIKNDNIISNEVNIPPHLIKHLANLRSVLDKREVDIIFELYNRFELLGQLQNKGKKEDLDRIEILIKNLSEDLFISVFLEYLWMDYLGENEKILNGKYYNILKKIQNKIGDTVLETRVYHGDMVSGIYTNGVATWENGNGDIIYLLKYEDGHIAEGKYFNYINNNYEVVFDGKFNRESNKFSGNILEFYKSRRVKYRGQVEDNLYDGEGIMHYDYSNANKPLFIGVWKDGKKDEGEYVGEYKSDIIYFKGKYKNGRPYSGKIKCNNSYCFLGAYGFYGIIENSKLIE
ncbi:MAG: hypothetical protein ACRC68_18370, partial [Clostridium sp.]